MLPGRKSTEEEDEKLILSYLKALKKRNPNEGASLIKIFTVLKKPAHEVLKTLERMESKGLIRRIFDEAGALEELRLSNERDPRT